MSEKRARVTIREVAQRAGVSQTTVSLVLNGKDASIPVPTRERVREAARELHYSTDPLARALVTRRTNIVGIVVPDIANPFFAQAVRCMQLALAERGYDVILCNSEERFENDLRYIRLLAGRSVDGLILTPSAEAFSPPESARLRALLAQLDIPYIFFDRYFEDMPWAAVDNEGSAYLAAGELLAHGHRAIGVVTGPLALNSSRNRLAGVRRALGEYGLILPDDLIFEGRYDVGTGQLGGELLLKRGVSAVFAFSDMQACGVYASARRMGKRIPEDCSVIGFDDSFCSSVLDVPLSTMRQPVQEIASQACNMLLERIGGGQGISSFSLPARLIARASVKNPENA